MDLSDQVRRTAEARLGERVLSESDVAVIAKKLEVEQGQLTRTQRMRRLRDKDIELVQFRTAPNDSDPDGVDVKEEYAVTTPEPWYRASEVFAAFSSVCDLKQRYIDDAEMLCALRHKPVGEENPRGMVSTGHHGAYYPRRAENGRF
jgi:hypothetical protein